MGLYFPKKRKGEGDELEREAKKDWIEVVVLAVGLEPEESLDTDCLVNRNPPKRERMSGRKKVNMTN